MFFLNFLYVVFFYLKLKNIKVKKNNYFIQILDIFLARLGDFQSEIKMKTNLLFSV